MKILFVDDEKSRHESFCRLFNHVADLQDGKESKSVIGGMEVTHVWNPIQANTCFMFETYDVVCLDHDLGAATGMEVVEKLIELEEDKRPNQVIIHSSNYPAGKAMASRLISAGFYVEHKPNAFGCNL